MNDARVTRAKMRCNSITKSGNEKFPAVQISLGAVYSNDPESENRSFASATPSADVRINIDAGRPAAQAFELGAEYYVDFIKCPDDGYRYLKDGVAPADQEVVICKRDHSGEVPAKWIYNLGQVSTTIDGEEITESYYNGTRLPELGYTHWRHLREGEKVPD